MSKEENNDFRINFRTEDNQLHEAQKIKINDLQEAEECIQYLKEQSKQVFEKEHNGHTYTLPYLRTDKQNKIQTPSKNDSDHRHINQLITELPSTKNSRTISAQAETSTIVTSELQLDESLGERAAK